MDTNIRTFIKSFSYRTFVAISIFLAATALNYSAGFGLKFIILSYTVGFASFFIQERIWNRIKWGKDGSYDLTKRSLAKTVTWRIWSFVVLYVLGLILGLNSSQSAEWSIVTNILFVIVHFVHERVWNLIKWGKKDEGTSLR